MRDTLTHPAKGLCPSAHPLGNSPPWRRWPPMAQRNSPAIAHWMKIKVIICEGHPHTPGKGAVPLCTPLGEFTSLAESPMAAVELPGHLAPSLIGRKFKVIICEGHPHTPGKGAMPLCTPLGEFTSLAEPPMAAVELPGHLAPSFIGRKLRVIICEGHPHTPGKGAMPLCTPLGEFTSWRSLRSWPRCPGAGPCG